MFLQPYSITNELLPDTEVEDTNEAQRIFQPSRSFLRCNSRLIEDDQRSCGSFRGEGG
jgi:hypothetical protein